MQLSMRVSGLLIALALAAGTAAAQDVNSQKGVISFIEPALPDPVLQHSKEIYVLYGCAYCHGVDLRVRNGEAADLLHSNMVGLDKKGNLIGPLLRAGVPQTPKLSPMPQFADLSDGEIADIVRWIHYARQQGRYKEVMDAKSSGRGDAATGKSYFDQKCATCHASAADLSKAAGNSRSELIAQMLRPKALDFKETRAIDQTRDEKREAARTQHLSLLENYSADDVNNLAAFIESSK